MSEKDQRVAIITGGSQGIGAGLVAAYRREGRAVVTNSRTIKPSADPAVLTVEGDIDTLINDAGGRRRPGRRSTPRAGSATACP